jgi:pimeloyl-ACP methyl ester carboxylesterase
VIGIDVSSTLRRCKQPILCISFRNDRVVPNKNVEDILREAPSATHATVPGGHFTGYTNSGLLAAEVEQFLARVDAP